jgi:phage shock protein C
MYCNYCGKVIQEDANLCAYCGTRVGGMIARKRLVRPYVGRKIAGVCMGVAEYSDLDVSLVRVVWAIVAILGPPIGIVGYIIAWIVMPNEPERMAAPANSVHASPPPVA